MKEIVWTPESIETYNSLVQYLISDWGKVPAIEFMNEVERVILLISKNPSMFRRSSRYHSVRIGYLTEQNSLIYRVISKEIQLLLFWDNRQDSKKLKY
jgi:plasmid stabilization system protein ParE